MVRRKQAADQVCGRLNSEPTASGITRFETPPAGTTRFATTPRRGHDRQSPDTAIHHRAEKELIFTSAERTCCCSKALYHFDTRKDGRIKGTLGGGCLEAEIQHRAIQSLRTGQASTFDLLLDHDFGWDDGLICGGKVFGVILPNAQNVGTELWTELAERKSTLNWGVKNDFSIALAAGRAGSPLPAANTQSYGGAHGVTRPTMDWLYHETITPPCALWIAGAGHIAQAVAPLALQLDFSVTVFDDRPALCNHQFFPHDVSLKADVWEKLLILALPGVPSFALIVTRGHRHDALVLEDWIHKLNQSTHTRATSRTPRTLWLLDISLNNFAARA